MPKTLILFHGAGDDVAALADATAEGARAVRFAEVDVRRLAAPGESNAGSRHRTLGSADELTGYDGLVLGTAGGSELPAALTRLLADAATLRGTLTLSVGSAFAAGDAGTETSWALLRALGALGVVLVPAGAPGAAPGRELGHRMAHAVSWITHARSHHH